MTDNKAYSVNLNMDPEEASRAPSTAAAGTLSRRESRAKEELWLPVVYHSVSAEVQNQLDRMTIWDLQEAWQEEQRRRSASVSSAQSVPLKPEEQEHFELINQVSVHRRQSRDILRQLSISRAAEAEQAKAEIPFPLPAPGRKEGRIDRAIRSMSRQEEHIIDVVKEASNDDHLVPLEVLEKRYETNMGAGLAEDEVSRRRSKDGLNVLSPPNRTPAWLAFLKCLVGGFGVVLWIAFVLCILAYEPLGDPPDVYSIILALVILSVILAQALFFFIQERRSSNLMAGFASLLPNYCEVLRDGEVKNVDAKELVVGDIVRIHAGDKVPADMRVFEVNQAKIEKSSLTGESEPIPLSVSSADPNMYETKNLALFGTSVLEGSAAGIVINTADRTIMGKIARVASSASSVSTSLQKEVNYFTGLVAVMAVIVCLIVLAGYYAGVAQAHPNYLSTSAVVISCIAVVVSLLPEGTPVALAMILTMIAKRMYTVKILVKKLTVLETLGSATVIASDKTGTLTQNRMTLNHLYIVNDYKGGPALLRASKRKKSILQKDKTLDEVEKTSTGFFGAKNIAKYLSEPAMTYLCQIMCLCNKTVFESKPEPEEEVPRFHRGQATRTSGPRKFVGNPTEGALLNAADEYLDTESIRHAAPIIKEIAFSSRTKYHLTIHRINDRQLFQNTIYAVGSMDGDAACSCIIFVKGAPEYVLGMCTRAVMNGDEVAMEPQLVSRIMKANELLASQGERVLAMAYRKLNAKEYPDNYAFDMDDEERWASELSFLGLAGIIDPPREGVADSIKECHGAHIRVMMVTGDQPTTAVAIARSVNIITHKFVKTIADVQSEVPDDGENDQEPTSQGNKWLSKLRKYLTKPPKRHFREASIVVAGNEIGQLTQKQWDFVLQHREVVFARTTPQQKLQIVKESRKRGDIVAVTGDGVNDAPALKAADLGVAMGICGSDVSKEAANMILLDDNFVTIINGIKEGRLLFDNLKKVICYLFPNGSFSEILPVLANVFLGMPLPLSTFLMIVICVGSDMIGSLGLIHEYAEADIMHRPPRDAHKDRLVNPRTILFAYFFVGIMESSIAFFMYFLTMSIGDVPPDKLVFAYNNWGKPGWVGNMTKTEMEELNYKGQTAFFVSLVVTQLWSLLAVRTRYQSIFRQKFQKKLLHYMMGEVAVLLCVVYLPVIQTYMHTQPMEYYHFLIPLGLGSMILIGDEIRKYLVRKYPKGILAKLAW